MNEDVAISVIIPSINRCDQLSNTLLHLCKQVSARFEVIVILQSVCNILTSASWPTNFLFITTQNQSSSAARNIGLKNSRSEVVLFIDDDVVIEDVYFLNKHLRHYSDENIVGVYGRQSLGKIGMKINATIFHRKNNNFTSWFYFPENYNCSTFIAVGRSNNLSIRRSIAIQVGGMDENYIRGAHREEADFCLRVFKNHGLFLYDPQAQLIHIGNSNGGIRSWNDNNFVRAEHNIVGAIYFDLKSAPLQYFLEYQFATWRYFFLNKTILSRPKLYPLIIKRLFIGYSKAIKLYFRHSKYI